MFKKLFRTVSQSEKEDIIKTERFNLVRGGFESKQFCTNFEEASDFCQTFSFLEKQPYYILSVEIPNEVYQKLDIQEDIDMRLVVTVQYENIDFFNSNIINIHFYDE